MKNSDLIKDTEYKKFINSIKENIKSSQIKAAVSVNKELLKLYWFMGSQITEKQKTAKWGDGFLKQLSKDLQNEFPEMKGFSYSNIKYIKQWYLFWNQQDIIAKQLVSQLENRKSQQPVGQSDNSIMTQAVSQLGVEKGQQLVAKLENAPIFQIPWGHNLVIISKSSSHTEALFYVNKTIENNWSRAVLVHQIESGLYERKGGAITNFDLQLPKPQSDLAKQTLKDPYCFDFLTMTERHNEQELEKALIDNITQFLLELGAGFAFVGKQFHLEVGEKDFYIDLLFYHTKLHCYVVIELKAVEFKPEFAGKLNFYITAVDKQIATESDKPTIGLLICKSKNKTIVEYALQGINKPLGVSEYELTKHLPDDFKGSLPSIEEIEKELEKRD